MQWCVLWFVVLWCGMGINDASTVTLQIEHRFGDEKFEPAGTVSGEILADGTLEDGFEFTRSLLSAAQQSGLKDLVKGHGYYSIRMRTSLSGKGDDYVMASVPIHCLLAEDSKETLTIELTADNKIIALDYGTNCPSEKALSMDEAIKKFGTVPIRVDHKYPKLATHLSMTELLIKVEKAEGGGDGEKPGTPAKTQKTWLQQNWLFVIAGSLIMFQILAAVGDPNGMQPNQGPPRR